MHDGEGKYTKKAPARRAAYQTAWMILFPAAATVTTDVWFPSAVLSSVYGYNLVLATVNITGAFMDGFFSAWDSGAVLPSGPKTEALHVVAEDVRAFYLSTYTSWAGMVGEAASIAYADRSVLVGLIYILMSIGCAFVAHGLGSDLAQFISSSNPPTNTSYSSSAKAHLLLKRFNIALALYILLSCALFMGTNNSIDSGGKEPFWIAVTPRNQLVTSIFFAIMGAHSGSIVGSVIARSLKNTTIPMGTLICNAIFGLLGLSLNVMRLRNASWAKSLILRGFSLNFCGAASAFAGHASDNRDLYASHTTAKSYRRVLLNVTMNMIFATMIFWIALEIEILLHQADEDIESL